MVDWPSSVKIGGHQITLEIHHGKLGDAAGEWLPYKHLIRLDDQASADADVCPGALLHCLVHELLHAIDGIYCDYKVFSGPKHGDESDWINPFAEGIVQVLFDNWEALKKLKKSLDKP